MNGKRVGCAVVIVISILAIGFVLEAISQLRVVEQRTACRNYLWMIANSLDNYHSAYRHLPRAILRSFGAEKDPELAPEKSLGWMVTIEPFMESRMGWHITINEEKPWDDEENREMVEGRYYLFQCPTIRGKGNNNINAYYVGIAGVGAEAANLPFDDPRIGAFGYGRTVRHKDITDGLANTMLVAETATANGPWASAGYSTVRPLDPDNPTYLGEVGQFSSHHGRRGWFSSQAFHTNVAFADRSVRSITDAVDPKVFEAMATIRGGEKVELPED